MSDWADEKAHALMWKLFPGGFAFRDEAKKDVAETLRKARADALEEAAKVAETQTAAPGQRNMKDQWRAGIGVEIAAAIRALKEGK